MQSNKLTGLSLSSMSEAKVHEIKSMIWNFGAAIATSILDLLISSGLTFRTFRPYTRERYRRRQNKDVSW